MVFTGTSAAINTALDGLAFAPNANFSGAASLQIVTDDQGNTGSGGALSDSDTINITVTPVNDGPVNNVPGPVSGSEDTALVFSAPTGMRSPSPMLMQPAVRCRYRCRSPMGV